MAAVQEQVGNLRDEIQQLQTSLGQGLVGLESAVKQVRGKALLGSTSDPTIRQFDGGLTSIDFNTWLEIFNILCEASYVEPHMKAKLLPAYLRDRARDIYDNLSEEEKKDFSTLCKSLMEG